MMTGKDLILNTLAKKPTDSLPFIPRLDNWYNANKANGTLPSAFKNATLRDMVDDLGWGYHAMVPDFRDFIDEDASSDVGLGIYNLKNNTYRIKFHNINKTVERIHDGIIKVEYQTPKGVIATTVRHDSAMKKQGITLYTITEHAIKSAKDFEAIAYIFENAEVYADDSHFEEYRSQFLGDRGVAVAFSALFASPMHFILRELMPMDKFYYALMDDKEALEDLANRMMPFCDKVFEAAANSSSEIVLSGSNYDCSITPGYFFEEYITPQLKKHAAMLHEKGKFLATHTDGENTGLLEPYIKSNIDLADSICPKPMTKISLQDTRKVFGDKITIWGGIPSITVLESTMSDKQFEQYIEDLLISLNGGGNIILSVADTVPPSAKFDRLKLIAKKAKEFGPVGI